MKKKFIIEIVVFVVFALIVYATVLKPYFNFQRTNVKNPEETTLKEVACSVIVTNPRGIPLIKNGDLVIESAECKQQYVSNCGRFGIFSDVGTIRLQAEGGLGSAADVKIDEGSSQSYDLNWCGSKLTKIFKLNLFNDKNQNIQTKEVTLQ